MGRPLPFIEKDDEGTLRGGAYGGGGYGESLRGGLYAGGALTGRPPRGGLTGGPLGPYGEALMGRPKAWNPKS